MTDRLSIRILNHQAMDWYQIASHLVPVHRHTERTIFFLMRQGSRKSVLAKLPTTGSMEGRLGQLRRLGLFPTLSLAAEAKPQANPQAETLALSWSVGAVRLIEFERRFVT